LTLVGDRGPEILDLPRGTNVINNSASKQLVGGLGSPTFIVNIDARGADPSLIARLPKIMEQRDRQLLLKVKTFVETGALTL